MQHGCNVLHILVGHLRNVDHAHAALRQRNKCAKRFYAGDTAFKNIPYLNRQNSIPLLTNVFPAGRKPLGARHQLPVTSTKMRSLAAA